MLIIRPCKAARNADYIQRNNLSISDGNVAATVRRCIADIRTAVMA